MRHLACYIALSLFPFLAFAQEERGDVYYAKRYLDINIKKQEKFNNRISKQQSRLLQKLGKKETRFARSLQRRDSAGFAAYAKNPMTFDSIRRQQPDSLSLERKSKRSWNNKFDTLNGIAKYAGDNISGENADRFQVSGYEGRLASLKSKGLGNQETQELIEKRMAFLNGLQGKNGNVAGLKSMQKQRFYAREKIGAFKQMADEPSIAEEKALEFLQGKEGFEKYLSRDGKQGMMSMNGASPKELQKMGFQTKQQVQESIQKKVGGANMGVLQQSMGGQVKDYQGQLQKVNELKQSATQTHSAMKGLKSIHKPDFKVNPMRGQPFMKRIEQQYNWQTTRATNNGRPAMLSFSYMIGFKHTPKLSYGLGVAPMIGLGSNWNNVRISFEGIGLRSYAVWQWQYGIGAYAGYERTYNQTVFGTSDVVKPILHENPRNNRLYSEAVLIGLTKSYKINDKMNGSIQLLYDVWWKEKGLRNPVQLRFATMKN